ncbi:MAG: hypothetical protein AAGF99_13490 [Bacteroidota bacterium]
MGQQQLLLLVLGIVIVGLAVVVGIESFSENKSKSEIDRYTAMGVEMGAEIIAWYKKPTAMGGGGEVAANLASIGVQDLGYDEGRSDSGTWGSRTGTLNSGVYRFVYPSSTAPYLQIHQDPIATGSVRVEVHVFGPYPECIVSRSDYYAESTTWSDGKASSASPDNPNATLCTW